MESIPETQNKERQDAPEKQDKSQLDLPDKVTAAWLFHHVPYNIWAWLCGSLITSFALGVTLGQTTFIQELFDKRRIQQIASVENKTEEDRLVKGHKDNAARIQEAIIKEETAAGDNTISASDRDIHSQAVGRLKEFLREEDERFLNEVKALKAMPSDSSQQIKNKVEQLIQAHNESISKIQEAIIKEEREAGNNTISAADRGIHAQAVKQFKALMKEENERFLNEVEALKSIK